MSTDELVDTITSANGILYSDNYSRSSRHYSDSAAATSYRDSWCTSTCPSRPQPQSSGMDDRDKLIYNSLGDTKGKVTAHYCDCGSAKEP